MGETLYEYQLWDKSGILLSVMHKQIDPCFTWLVLDFSVRN